MHTLFSFPFSCALAVEITLARRGLPYEVVDVQRGPNRKVTTDALAQHNPKRKVPTLVLPDGSVLTEIVSVLFHLERDTPDERRRLELLAFIATELHQQILGPTFDKRTPAAAITDIEERLLGPVLEDVVRLLDGRTHLLGARLGAVDAYLLWALMLVRFRWPERIPVALGPYLKAGLSDPAAATAIQRARMKLESTP